MGNIIPLNSTYQSNPNYQLALLELSGTISAMEEVLKDNMINLATIGKWKEWSDAIPEGDVFTFTEEMLSNTGDKNIEALYQLIHQMMAIKSNFKINL
ncbi:MAG: hypothetical protein PSX81_09640 [bacterium]|nr:hypothetical protein [bacterium]